MQTVPSTQRQSLENLKNRAFNSMYKLAQSTRDLAVHQWHSPERKERVLQLAGFVKKDLVEFQRKLHNIDVVYNKLSPEIRNSPAHPHVLQTGGKYISFIDDLNVTVGNRVNEMVEMMTLDIDEMSTQLKQAAV